MLDFSLNDLASNFLNLSGPAVASTATNATSFEEERRRNMAEVAAAAVPSTQPEQPSLGPAVMARAPGAGRGFINPKYALGAREPENQPETAPVPVSDRTAYNATIQQQESGNRPNMGFHNQQLSSAYGPYGMTAGAYEDARRRNPNLPADITQASPAQLTEAQNAFTDANAGYLKNYGIDVNNNTLSAAHFIGAKGLNDFYTKKDEQGRPYISPAAQAANGGYEKTREIIEKRLGGQAAPASGAVSATPAQPPAPTEAAPITPEQAAQQAAYTGQGIKTPGGQTLGQLQQDRTYDTILNSNSVDQIGKAAFDINTPPQYAAAMLDKLHNTMAIEEAKNRAMKRIAEIQANPTPQNINRAMNDKRDGSIIKAIFYGLMGARDKEKEEWDRIDPKIAYTTANVGDQQYSVKYNPNTNEVLDAWGVDRKPVGDAVLGQIQAQGVGGKKWHTGAEFFQDKAGNIYKSQENDLGQTRFINAQTSAPYTGTEKLERLRDVSKLTQLGVAQGYRRENFDNSVIAALKKKRGTDVLGALSDFEKQSATPLTEEDRMAFVRQYGGYAVPGATTAPATTAAPAPAVQGGAQPTAPAPTTTAPATTAAPAPAQATDAGGFPINAATKEPIRTAQEGADHFNKRHKDWADEQEVSRKGRQEVVKKAQDVVAGADKIVSGIEKVNDALFTLQNKKTNFGTIIHGTIPGEQAVGKFFKTEDHTNTMQVLEEVNKVAAANAKMLGANPTDKDLQFVTSTKPDITWSASAVEEWLRRSAKGQQNALDFARKQIESGGNYIPSTPEIGATGGGMTPAEKARAELERRRKGNQ